LVELMKKLQTRRDLSVAMLNAIPGISCVKPGGAFYAFPQIQLPAEADDESYVIELLEETGVLVVYGKGFGEKPGTNHFRIVFLPDEKILTQAYERIGQFTDTFYTKYRFTPTE
jgi:alanine-synthesizing transaminase